MSRPRSFRTRAIVRRAPGPIPVASSPGDAQQFAWWADSLAADPERDQDFTGRSAALRDVVQFLSATSPSTLVVTGVLARQVSAPGPPGLRWRTGATAYPSRARV